MVSDELKKKVEQTRRDGYMVFDLSGNPISLAVFMTIIQDVFPNHQLEQLYFTQAEEDQFVVRVDPIVGTRPS